MIKSSGCHEGMNRDARRMIRDDGWLEMMIMVEDVITGL